VPALQWEREILVIKVITRLIGAIILGVIVWDLYDGQDELARRQERLAKHSITVHREHHTHTHMIGGEQTGEAV